MSLQTENMCGYQLRTGWGGFIGVLLMLPEASAHVFLCRAWEEGAGWPGSSVCGGAERTFITKRKPRGGEAF